MNRLLLSILACCVGLSACSKDEGAAVAAAPLPNSGKVLQIRQAGPYAYAEVDAGGGQVIWMAGAAIAAKPGDTLQWSDYAVMRNFYSRTLDRNFAEILFVNTWGPVGGRSAQAELHGARAG